MTGRVTSECGVLAACSMPMSSPAGRWPTTAAGKSLCSASKKQGACSATRRTSAGGSCSSRARALTSLAGRGRDRGGLAPGTASEEQRRGLAAARGEDQRGVRRQRLERLDVGQRRALVEGLGQQPVALV